MTRQHIKRRGASAPGLSSGHGISAGKKVSIASGTRPQRAGEPSQQRLAARGWNRLLVAVDRGSSARQALEVAVSMAARLQAALALVYVVDCTETESAQLPRLNGAMQAKLAAEGRQWIDGIANEVQAGAAVQFVRVGDPAVEILAIARQWRAELIIIGNHGLTHTGRFFLGNTVETVVRDAPCPVMTVPPGVK